MYDIFCISTHFLLILSKDGIFCPIGSISWGTEKK